jgi:hypothetical protein
MNQDKQLKSGAWGVIVDGLPNLGATVATAEKM